MKECSSGKPIRVIPAHLPKGLSVNLDEIVGPHGFLTRLVEARRFIRKNLDIEYAVNETKRIHDEIDRWCEEHSR